ncbi:hypothetical protein LP414_06640 [Polaromonas sp. P1(28)-13]|nr:hypothetical protein LP414_06640 [Polaromonas sp. P1(28)-13]
MLAEVEHADAVGHGHDQVHVVFDHHQRDAFALQVGEQFNEAGHVIAAQARGRFVQHQHPRAVAVGQRDRQHALHAVRDLLRAQRVVAGRHAEAHELRRGALGRLAPAPRRAGRVEDAAGQARMRACPARRAGCPARSSRRRMRFAGTPV